MDLKPGDVVVLKSGGQALTVAEVNDKDAECIWIGDDGDLFRETLPLIVLERAEIEASEEDQDDAHDNGEDDDDEEDEDERHVA